MLFCESFVTKVFLSSGLGGMSGAQAKAAVISGCIGVIAEVGWGVVLPQIRHKPSRTEYTQGAQRIRYTH